MKKIVAAAARTPPLGRIGIWSFELRFGDPDLIADAAAELDELGFGALWIPGALDGNLLQYLDRLLSATRRAAICAGILNIWKHEPKDVAAWWKSQPADRRERILLGLGVSHAPSIGDAYRKPLGLMDKYLTDLFQQGVPAQGLCLAALGPQMLKLADLRTAGAHPYLVTPEHTAQARAILSKNALLAPEQGVLLESNLARARAGARQFLMRYAKLPNYTNAWLRLGFTQNDVDTLSDRLVDRLIASGDAEQIAVRIKEHLSAGADHVCLQVLSDASNSNISSVRAAWRALAAALL